MRIRDAIVIGATLAVSGMLFYFFCIRPIKEVHPTDPGKAERDSLSIEAKVYKYAYEHWRDSAAYYKALYQQAASIPPTVIINDAVTSMHSAPVDSVQRVLLSEPR